jgi:PST family polysaccharide transporter
MFDKLKPSIFFNINAQLAGQIAVTLTQLTYVILAARYLDVRTFGIFSFAIGIAQMVLVVSDLGLNLLTARQIASSPLRSRDIFRQVLPLKLIVATSFGVALITIAKPWVDAETMKALTLFSAGMVLHSIAMSFNMGFQGHGELYISSASAFLLTLSQLVVGAICLVMGGGVISLGAAYLVSAALMLVVTYFVFTRRVHPIDFALSLKSTRVVMRQSLPMGAGAALGTIANRADIALVFSIAGAAQLGIYAAAYRITGTLYNIPTAIFSAVLPFMSRLSWKTPEMNITVERTLLASIIAGSCLFLFFAIAGTEVTSMLFGKAYAPSGVILRILSWALLPAFINVGLLHAAVSQKSTAFAYATTAAVGALVNITLNLWWIPIWKSLGASYATIATESTILISYMWCLRRDLQIQSLVRPVKILGLSVAAGLFSWSASLNGVRSALLVIAIYALVAFYVGAFSLEDWAFWTQRLTPKIEV